MFTLVQIQEAHSKVLSGSDFPNYVQDLRNLGVLYYETYVGDGHTEYYGDKNYMIKSASRYDILSIGDSPLCQQFKKDLKVHQEGKTDYRTFCNDAAKSGVYQWKVDMDKMTCTYFDKKLNEILVENIPQ